MIDFELLLACLLIPVAYVAIYIAGKYDMITLICRMFEEKCKEFEEHQQYKELGTLEELNDELYSLRASIDFYQAIGSVTECRKAVEQQTPKKVNLYIENDMTCPECGKRLRGYDGIKNPYCKFCGQALER